MGSVGDSALLGSGSGLQVGWTLWHPQPRRCQSGAGPGGAGLEVGGTRGGRVLGCLGPSRCRGPFLPLPPRAEEFPGLSRLSSLGARSGLAGARSRAAEDPGEPGLVPGAGPLRLEGSSDSV